jgi:hypothetical protein
MSTIINSEDMEYIIKNIDTIKKAKEGDEQLFTQSEVDNLLNGEGWEYIAPDKDNNLAEEIMPQSDLDYLLNFNEIDEFESIKTRLSKLEESIKTIQATLDKMNTVNAPSCWRVPREDMPISTLTATRNWISIDNHEPDETPNGIPDGY